MEIVREIAMTYYQTAPQKEKDEFQAFFSAVDANGDGNITLTEFKAPFESHAPLWAIEALFSKVGDANGDGKLDSAEALTIYFMLKKNVVFCDGCFSIIVGKYGFLCLDCQATGSGCYALCCGCYHAGKYKCPDHKDSKLVMDKQSPINYFVAMFKDQIIRSDAIKELHQIAKSYYKACSDDVQAQATEFFELIDRDGDDKVDLEEFLSCMKVLDANEQMETTSLFAELDEDGDGKLDFSEVMTLYYIIRSGRPFCGECKKLIPGTYFSCFECYSGGSSFTLCLDCHGSPSARSSHTHKDPVRFLDNYALQNVTKGVLALYKAETKCTTDILARVAAESNKTNRLEKSVSVLGLAMDYGPAALAVGSVLCTIM